MKSNQSLPVIIGYPGVTFAHGKSLRFVHVDALRFDHRESRVDRFDFSSKLFLTDWAGVRLQQHLGPSGVNRHGDGSFPRRHRWIHIGRHGQDASFSIPLRSLCCLGRCCGAERRGRAFRLRTLCSWSRRQWSWVRKSWSRRRRRPICGVEELPGRLSLAPVALERANPIQSTRRLFVFGSGDGYSSILRLSLSITLPLVLVIRRPRPLVTSRVTAWAMVRSSRCNLSISSFLPGVKRQVSHSLSVLSLFSICICISLVMVRT